MNTFNKDRLTPAQIKAILYRRALLHAIKSGLHKKGNYNPSKQVSGMYPKKLSGKGRKKKKCACKQKGRGLDIRNHHMSLGDMKLDRIY